MGGRHLENLPQAYGAFEPPSHKNAILVRQVIASLYFIEPRAYKPKRL